MRVSLLLLVVLAARVLGQAVPSNYLYPVPLPTTGDISPTFTQQLNLIVNPTGYADHRPAVWDAFIGGGYRSVSSTAERDSINAYRRKEGMLVWVAANSHTYRLNSNLTSWTDLGTLQGGADTSIFLNDGTLEGDRVLTGGGNDLTFTGIKDLTLLSTNFIYVQAPYLVLNSNVTNGFVQIQSNTSTTNFYSFPYTNMTASGDDAVVFRSKEGWVKHNPPITFEQITNAVAGPNHGTINVTADNQVITVGDYDSITLVSDSNVYRTRTVKLTTPSYSGQTLTLIASLNMVSMETGANSGAGFTYVVEPWDSISANETITFIANGNNWAEVGRSGLTLAIRTPLTQSVVAPGGNTPATGDVLTYNLGTGTADWEAPSGGQNISNADLTSDGPHVLNVDGHDLQIINADDFNVIADDIDFSIANSFSVAGPTVHLEGQWVTIGTGHAAGPENYSFARGVQALASHYGAEASASGAINNAGDAQKVELQLRGVASEGDPVILTTDGISLLPVIRNNGTTWLVALDVVARTSGTGSNKSATFRRTFQIDRPTIASSTTLQGAVQTVGTDTGSNAGSPPVDWEIDIVADTTNSGFTLTFTGDSSADAIYVHANVVINQVVYP